MLNRKNMSRIILFSLLLAGLTGPLEAGEGRGLHGDTFGVYRAVMVKEGPVIDGDLADLVWQKAKEVSGFVASAQPPYKEPTAQTRVRLLIGPEALYLGLICEEPYIQALVTEHRGRDLWRDDCVEIFLDVNHDHSSYLQLMVNSLGLHYALLWPGGVSWMLKHFVYEEIEPPSVATTAARRGADYWSVEIRLPFTSLDIPPPREGDLWGLGIGRERWGAVPGVEVSFLGFGQEGAWFHLPRNFGHLIIGSPTPKILQMYEELSRLRKEAQERVQEMAEMPAELLQRWERLAAFSFKPPEAGEEMKLSQFSRDYLILERVKAEFSGFIMKMKFQRLIGGN